MVGARLCLGINVHSYVEKYIHTDILLRRTWTHPWTTPYEGVCVDDRFFSRDRERRGKLVCLLESPITERTPTRRSECGRAGNHAIRVPYLGSSTNVLRKSTRVVKINNLIPVDRLLPS